MPINIFYTNANGLFNKIDELKCIVSMYKSIEVICVTETHFSSDILDAEIYIEGFSMFRKDRDFRIDNSTANISGGGGSIIYVKNCCNASLVNSFLKAPDSLAVNINTSGGLISICCIYRSTSLNLEQNNALISCIKSICSERNDFETLLLGDFNLPNVLWETGSINSNIASKNQFLVTQQKYMDVFNDSGLTWYFTNETTRRRLVKDTLQESLLDQVLYTNDALVNGCKIVSPLGKSDHVGILVELVVSPDTNKCLKEKIFKPIWGKISSAELLKFSLKNIDWDYSSTNDVQDMWAELHGKLETVAAAVPTASVYLDNRVQTCQVAMEYICT